MIKLCPLWRTTTKDGKSMLSGPVDSAMPILGGCRILIFKNDSKEGKQPDYFLYLAGGDEPKNEPNRSSAEAEPEEVPF